MKVFIAHTGEYEQRGISAVFTSEAKARECSEDIEEYEVDAHSGWERGPVFRADIYVLDGSLRGAGKPWVQIEFRDPNTATGNVHGCLGSKEPDIYRNSSGVIMFSRGTSAKSHEEAVRLAQQARYEKESE